LLIVFNLTLVFRIHIYVLSSIFIYLIASDLWRFGLIFEITWWKRHNQIIFQWSFKLNLLFFTLNLIMKQRSSSTSNSIDRMTELTHWEIEFHIEFLSESLKLIFKMHLLLRYTSCYFIILDSVVVNFWVRKQLSSVRYVLFI